MNPWWRVDLQSTKQVVAGKLWGRTDCCQSLLDGFQIWIGNAATFDGTGNINCFTATSTEHNLLPYTHSFTCNGTGRYVFVTLPGTVRTLSLVEFEVYDSGTYSSIGVIF